ncbi:MAG: hypothetical protein ACK417_01760 [Bacteroidia bacterium]
MQKLILLVLLVLSNIACRKENQELQPENPNSPATPVLISEKGSYFVYHIFEIDSSGNETPYGRPDTIFVEGDSLINGNRYVHLKDQWFNIGLKSIFFRDSSGYIVDEAGLIHWANRNLPDTVRFAPSNILMEWYYFGRANRSFQLPSGRLNGDVVPARTESAFELEMHYYYTNGTRMSVCDSGHIQKRTFVSGVGLASSQLAWISLMYSDCKYYERRLVYYAINP